MGVDIKGVFERKNENGEWEIIESHYGFDRDYYLFYVLTGAHKKEYYNVAPISEPRDVPDDCSYITDSGYYRDSFFYRKNGKVIPLGDYAISWLTGDEIIKWFDKNKDVDDEWHKNIYYFHDEIIRLVKLHGNIRFIFGLY